MCTWMQRLCQHLRNKNDEEQPIRHKEDLPTTGTDTNFIAVHREVRIGSRYRSHIPTKEDKRKEKKKKRNEKKKEKKRKAKTRKEKEKKRKKEKTKKERC